VAGSKVTVKPAQLTTPPPFWRISALPVIVFVPGCTNCRACWASKVDVSVTGLAAAQPPMIAASASRL